MLAIERRNAIISRLNMDGKVIVTDLAKEFDVTEETI
ncbi:MAG: DeoR family transcriptional regulator, partial [Clostridia bacterium]|nr:DeoR family transcriptional regulator [Clostridia bacterium]